jgi:GNAT superfamily N-acetyltransferase
MITIEYLKNYPEYLQAVVEWVYPEWWQGKYAFSEVVEIYKTVLNDNVLPIGLIAFENDTPVGSGLLCKDDPDIKIGVSPWLEGLYVQKEHRKCGIGKALIMEIEDIAIDLGYRYLYLSSDLENFYEKLGFFEIKRLENGDRVFEKILNSGKVN